MVCGDYDRDEPTVEPRFVIEVLSPSSRQEDRTIKLDEYKGLPFVEEVWLVDSERRWGQRAIGIIVLPVGVSPPRKDSFGSEPHRP